MTSDGFLHRVRVHMYPLVLTTVHHLNTLLKPALAPFSPAARASSCGSRGAAAVGAGGVGAGAEAVDASLDAIVAATGARYSHLDNYRAEDSQQRCCCPHPEAGLYEVPSLSCRIKVSAELKSPSTAQPSSDSNQGVNFADALIIDVTITAPTSTLNKAATGPTTKDK